MLTGGSRSGGGSWPCAGTPAVAQSSTGQQSGQNSGSATATQQTRSRFQAMTLDKLRKQLEQAGFKPGDIINRSGQQTVGNPSDLANVVDQARKSGKGHVILLRRRDGQSLFVPLPPG